MTVGAGALDSCLGFSDSSLVDFTVSCGVPELRFPSPASYLWGLPCVWVSYSKTREESDTDVIELSRELNPIGNLKNL